MEILSKANEKVLAILGKPKQSDAPYRKMHFCVEQHREDGVLWYNQLTKELLFLTREEYAGCLENDYLRRRWFVVPQGTKEKSQADMVKWVLSADRKNLKEITAYTIFPTTDCNARCFYCFELNRSRTPMSPETAHKVAEYIQNHCGGKKVGIAWFGGEPLYNQDAMDVICTDLKAAGIEFTSKMTTNAYLFDETAVKKAVQLWNLKRVQITLDGTEPVYNRIKAYIYKEGNPFQTVLDNMQRLLDAGLLVTVRMNMDLKNAEDLLDLTDQLARRFGGRKNFNAYANHLFKGDQAMADTYTQEEWTLRGEAMDRIEQRLANSGLAAVGGVAKKASLHYCMADSGDAVTILPNGDIGLCEHFSETEFIGHIDREGFDQAVIKSWKETTPPIAECATCFCYPACIMLRKCANRNKCFQEYRQERLRKTRQQMEHEYTMWQQKQNTTEDDPDAFC